MMMLVVAKMMLMMAMTVMKVTMLTSMTLITHADDDGAGDDVDDDADDHEDDDEAVNHDGAEYGQAAFPCKDIYDIFTCTPKGPKDPIIRYLVLG